GDPAGTRLTRPDWPSDWVRTVRVRSMSGGVEAVTATPGSTPADASRPTPAMLPLSAVCARTGVGRSAEHTRKERPRIRIFMVSSGAPTIPVRYTQCVPELPEAEYARRRLQCAMAGARIRRVVVRQPQPRHP